ncbi:MAG: hypothetical protein AAGD07_08560 [Planctomycetota bacterium]
MPTNESNPLQSEGKTPRKPILLGRLKQARQEVGTQPDGRASRFGQESILDSGGPHPEPGTADSIDSDAKSVISTRSDPPEGEQPDTARAALPLPHAGRLWHAGANQRDEPSSGSSTHAQIPTQSILTVTLMSLLGAAGFTVALSPLGIGQIAFLITLPWAWLTIDARRLTVSSYAVLYLSGVLMWTCLLLVESRVTTPYWTAAFLQVAYLATGLPVFVFVGRLGRRLFMVPTYLWLPMVWCSIEYARGNFLGGFALGLLGHAVADSRRVLQLTDLLGTYGLGALMVACGSSVAELLWLFRRLRQLEKRMPQLIDPTAEPDADVRDADARQVLAAGRSFSGRPVVRRPRYTAARSMLEALRRNRDQTRDHHLVLAVMAVTVMVAIMLFADRYGRSRVAETGSWKMFESNLFPFLVVGGPNTRELLGRPSTRAADGVVVSALTGSVPRTPIGSEDDCKTLLIVIKEDEDWDAELRIAGLGTQGADAELVRNHVEQPEYTDTADKVFQSEPRVALVSHPEPRVAAQPKSVMPFREKLWHCSPDCLLIHPVPGEFPVRIACLRTGTATIEQSLMEVLHARADHGSSIDAAVLVIDPGPWGASAWPRLMTRSVMASAVATRCPVVGIVPEQALSVANGDGQLFASATAPKEHREGTAVVMDLIDSDATRNPEELGEITDGLVHVQSMIDPRSSFYVKSGGWFPLICLFLTFAMCLGGALRSRATVGTTR